MATIAFISPYDDFALGVRIMASYLEANGHTVFILFFKKSVYREIAEPIESPLNYMNYANNKFRGSGYDVNPITEYEYKLLDKALAKICPDIIGVGSRSFWDDLNRKLIGRIRQSCPGAIIVSGGYGPMLRLEKYLDVSDYVVIGEGEQAMLGLAQYIDGQIPIEKVPNIIWENSGDIHKTYMDYSYNVDLFPCPKYREPGIAIIEKDTFRDVDPAGKTYYTLLGRGCIGSCSYCSAGQYYTSIKSFGGSIRKRRIRDVGPVIEELENAKKRGAAYIDFMDPYFTADKKTLKNFFSLYKERIGLFFSAQMYLRQILEYPILLDLACDAGLNYMVIGIQSGCERFSKEVYNRNVKNSEIIKAIKLLKHRKLGVDYHFIAGNPLEDADTFLESLNFASILPHDIRRDNFRIFRLFTFPDTPIEKLILSKGCGKVSASEWQRQCLLYAAAFLGTRRELDMIIKDRLFNDNELFEFFVSALWDRKRTQDEKYAGEEKLIVRTFSKVLRTIKTPIIIWGTGDFFDIISTPFLDQEVFAFIDSDPNKWGLSFRDRTIYPPDQLHSMPNYPVFLCATNRNQIRDQIRNEFPGILEYY
jgi:radical SAM superfamily enzyme YgiQ (UPF0313 family)